MKHYNDLTWMNDVRFEVKNPTRIRRVRFWRAFCALTFLTVIACALAGLSH
jgi:hypothetical protein